MNSLNGTIKSVNVNGSMSIAEIDMGHDITLKTIVLETPETASYLTEGNAVKVLFKETEVVIGLQTDLKISLQNRIPGIIEVIELGSLISKITINTDLGTIVSVISRNSVDTLRLIKGSSVVAMIKLNEVMLSQ